MEKDKTPTCIGFIMDGNRRWAKERGLSPLEGHREGYRALQSIISTVYDAGVPHMVCYAFSTENWKRTEEEVGYLMSLLEHAIGELPHILEQEHKNVAIRIVGEREQLPKTLQNKIRDIELQNPTHPHLTVWVALSYGGRAEILAAVNTAVEKGRVVTEEQFGALLWTSGMPDPDIVVRTSGEKRISNFLLWQSAYSEFFFIDTLWPDFGKKELESILEEYASRDRRKGT